jgi:hypothetical protein
MKVYLATKGDYDDFQVKRVFARKEDAQTYELADDWEEFEVDEGPVEVRDWHVLVWHTLRPDCVGDLIKTSPNPQIYSRRKDFDGQPDRLEQSADFDELVVAGWDLERVQKVYSEQRAQYIARKDMGVES